MDTKKNGDKPTVAVKPPENPPENTSIVQFGTDGRPSILISVEALRELLSQNTKKQPRFQKSKYPPIKVVDTQTNKEYKSLAECARTIAPDEWAENHFVYYDLKKKFPNRFKEIRS